MGGKGYHHGFAYWYRPSLGKAESIWANHKWDMNKVISDDQYDANIRFITNKKIALEGNDWLFGCKYKQGDET